VALFHATAVPGILPSELFPHEDRAPLSRPLAPLQLSTDVQKRVVHCRSPPVSPTSTPSRGCLDPRTTMDFLSADRSPLPGRPELSTAESLRSASFTYFEAFFPSQDRSQQLRVAPRPPAVALWSSAPPKLSPTTPWILDPPSPGGLNTLLRPQTPVRDSKDRWPFEPGETFLSTRSAQEDLVDGFQTPYGTGPHRLSTATPSLLALVAEQARRPDLQSF
jgi:hypothetical protein